MRQSLSNDTDSPIVAEGITKRFGHVTALDGLNLHVKTGEVHGFLGPNGAGKSTTIRAILGQLRLDQGHLRLFGGDPWHDAADLHKRVAYVPGDTALWPSLSGGECIDLIGGLQGSLDPRRRAELIDRFELDPRRKAGSYSKGNRQKVALVAALATQAELLLLDEPTSGLDPVMEQRFIDTVREAKAEGRTVLLSSHIMSEVEQLCDRVTIIRAGKDIVSDSLDALRAQATVRIEARWPGIGPVRRDVAPTDVVATVSRLTEQKPADLTVTPASLDELFWRHYEETSR
ncbi:ABC transporter ATP-binding protein [Corynebacterium sp. H127]|uniref:ABC transporter ATP-binding protein n=1 Tax=Corynebacterium sp. H127 TaxID=3133418 RepID=UPI0030A95B71